jgi:hypothetical protein
MTIEVDDETGYSLFHAFDHVMIDVAVVGADVGVSMYIRANFHCVLLPLLLFCTSNIFDLNVVIDVIYYRLLALMSFMELSAQLWEKVLCSL